MILHQEFGDSKIEHEDLSGQIFNLFTQMNPHSFETSESQGNWGLAYSWHKQRNPMHKELYKIPS